MISRSASPAALLALAGACAGADLDPGRFVTLDTGVIAPGTNELDLGVTGSRATRAFNAEGHEEGRGGAWSTVVGTIGIIHGFTANVDASLTGGYARIHDQQNAMSGGRGTETGPTDAQASSRWRFWSSDGVELAIVPILTIPAGSLDYQKGLPTASDRWRFGCAVVETWFLDHAIVGAHLRYDRHLTDSMVGDRDTLSLGAAFGVQVLPWLQPEAELSYLRNWASGAALNSTVTLATVGIQMHPSENVRIGLGGQSVVAGVYANGSWSIITVLAIGF